MKVKALISFSGAVSMTQGQTMNIEEGEVLTDLLQCAYVEEVEKRVTYIETKPIYIEQEPEQELEQEQEKEPEQEPEQEKEQEQEPKALIELEPEQVPAKKASRSKSKAVSADESE